MSAFAAELAARPAIAQFIAKFGNDSYYAHNAGARIANGGNALASKIEGFDLEAAAEAQARAEAARACGSCSGC